jgi:MOSC domain-containing protein YiiM/GNAT superfamily N-acetyltransferase
MGGRVLQVNVSPGGVPKLPVAEARVGRMGLDGDAHHHSYVHGGPHRAVALFAIEAIERVQADGHPGVVPGAVGENLTTTGIDLARLPVGTRLAIGDDDGIELEISGPANPCDVIKGAFRAGKSGRISILLHPDDSRMYARVRRGGVVRPNDPIEILPPAAGSDAAVNRELDLLESVEVGAWLAMWTAARDAGCDVRILEHGDLAAAASPDIPGSSFNRSFGLRNVPIHRDEVEAMFRTAGVTGWHVAGPDDPTFAGEAAEEPTSVHVGAVDEILAGSDADGIEGVEIRVVDPDDVTDVDRWADLFVRGFELAEPLASAWPTVNRRLAHAHNYRQLIARVDGRDVGVAAMFVRRRVAWLGGAAVVPEARGRGVQRALIADRLRRAADARAHKALATADIGSRSAANLEAAGLRRIWTRVLYRVD